MEEVAEARLVALLERAPRRRENAARHARLAADGGDHPVAGIEELMKVVPSRIERFGDVAQRDLHFGDPATHAGVDGLGRVDVLNVGSSQREEPARRGRFHKPQKEKLCGVWKSESP